MGPKPSARQGEARLRGRERNDYSKTIISVYAPRAPRLGGEQYIHRRDAEGAEHAERSAHTAVWTGLHLSPQAGAARNAAADKGQRL